MGLLYKYEISKANKILEENEKLYFNVIFKNKSNEESKIYFIKCHMEKFAKIYSEFNSISQEFINV